MLFNSQRENFSKEYLAPRYFKRFSTAFLNFERNYEPLNYEHKYLTFELSRKNTLHKQKNLRHIIKKNNTLKRISHNWILYCFL